MPAECENQFSLTRSALSTCRAQKQIQYQWVLQAFHIGPEFVPAPLISEVIS